MRIQLSEHFTYRKLLRFTLPSVIMMVCTSIYGVVDGVFVSNFVGSDAFAAVNLIMPFLIGVGCRGLHAGYRWQCAGGVHPGSRQRKACQRDLLPADLCADWAGCRVHHRRHCLSHAYVPLLAPCRKTMLPVCVATDVSSCWACTSPLPPASPTSCWTLCSWRLCNGHPPRSKKGHGRHSLSCPFLCLLTARSRQPWGCRQPETRRCRCAWW